MGGVIYIYNIYIYVCSIQSHFWFFWLGFVFVQLLETPGRSEVSRQALSAGIDAVLSAMSGEARFANENEVPCQTCYSQPYLARCRWDSNEPKSWNLNWTYFKHFQISFSVDIAPRLLSRCCARVAVTRQDLGPWHWGRVTSHLSCVAAVRNLADLGGSISAHFTHFFFTIQNMTCKQQNNVFLWLLPLVVTGVFFQSSRLWLSPSWFE